MCYSCKCSLLVGPFRARRAGGIVFAVSPRLRSLYPEVDLDPVVVGRVGVLRLRRPDSLALNLANIHLVSDAGVSSQESLRRLCAALLPMVRATTVLIGHFNFVSSAEGGLDVASGEVRHSRSIEAERFLEAFADFMRCLRTATREGSAAIGGRTSTPGWTMRTRTRTCEGWWAMGAMRGT